MSDNEASITRLLDEAAIRDTTARFADILMRADYEGFRTLWADDAEWVIGGSEGQPFERRAKGADDIVSLFRDLWKGNDSFIHFALQGLIAINGDDATAQCLCHESARGPEERYYRTPVYGLIAYGAQTMAGCSPAVPTGTCGSTCPHFLEALSRFCLTARD